MKKPNAHAETDRNARGDTGLLVGVSSEHLSPDNQQGVREIVAYQVLLRGKWHMMPGDWDMSEAVEGQQYRPLYADAPSTACRETLLRDQWHILVEKDDRNSPEEYPEMCLITREEVGEIISAALAQSPANRGETWRNVIKQPDERSLPTYGQIPWDQLGRDVNDATSANRRDYEFDPSYYPGHQMVSGLNFNSLARIVDKYRYNGLPCAPNTPESAGTKSEGGPFERHIQNSMPSDGFDCIYLFENGVEVGVMNGPQSDLSVQRRAADWVLSNTPSPALPGAGALTALQRVVRAYKAPAGKAYSVTLSKQIEFADAILSALSDRAGAESGSTHEA